jgi:hypothetical protein
MLLGCRSLTLCLSVYPMQHKSLKDIYIYMFSCRICVNSSLIAVQIWSQGRLSPDFFKLPFPSFKLITLFDIEAAVCWLVPLLVVSASCEKLQNVSAHQCLYSIQHMMFGRCQNSYPLPWSISAWKWTWLLVLFSYFTLQGEHVLSPQGSDPQNLWGNCRMDITKCSSKQLEVLQGCNGILCG